jgi:nucleoside-diphosphate-sugar epimerase
MNTLVTGANGFMGSQLVRRLLKDGHAVRALVRPTANLELLEGLQVERAPGDVTDEGSVERAMRGVDVVYHLAGIRRTPHAEDFDRVNAQGTKHVLAAAAAQPTPPRVVLAGSLSAMGPSTPTTPLDETAPFAPVEAYGRSKVRAEQYCAEFAGRVPYAIGRPPRVLGPGDRENLAFVKMVKAGLLLQIKGGPRPLSMVDVDDVVAGFALLGTHPAAVGETFFLTSPETLTVEHLQELATETLGLKTKLRLHVSPRVLRAAAHGADATSKLTGKHLPLNQKLAEQLLAPAWTCNPKKAEDLLGFRTTYSLAESVRRSVRWYVEKGWV